MCAGSQQPHDMRFQGSKDAKDVRISPGFIGDANRAIQEFGKRNGKLSKQIQAALARPGLYEQISPLARALSHNLDAYINPVWRRIQAMSANSQLSQIVADVGAIGLSANQRLEAMVAHSTVPPGVIPELQSMLRVPLHTDLPEIARLNIVSSYSLPSISFGKVASAVGVTVPQLRTLVSAHRDFVSAYASFVGDAVPLAETWSSHLLKFARLAAEGHYLHTDVLSQLSDEPAEPIVIQARGDIQSTILDAESERVVLLLSRFDPRLTEMLEGARNRLRADAPDMTRHVSASLRELLTHVLHGLAPDEEVLTWASTEPELLHEGRPTRSARLLHILRKCKDQLPERLLRTDTAAALALFDVLNQGQHEVEHHLTPKQLGTVLARAEVLLLQLLEATECGTD